MPLRHVKKGFLRDVIAKKRIRKKKGCWGEYPSSVEDVFKVLFPTVHRFIRDFNCDGREHKNLIPKLQRQEAHFVIEIVCTDLMKRHLRMFFITLHDCIMCRPKDVPKVKAGFRRGFKKIGLTMGLKVGD